ncbi:MAG: dimethyladenosine transferase [Ilumatobacter sp.]|nr:MAG: dimethyladenosine transferase [Ilumatobacter sp.]
MNDNSDDRANADTNDGESGRIERATRFVPAPPEAIFELLSDPGSHALIDGSGTVRGARDASPERLTLGSKFGMQMRLGVPYRITNEVVEFDEPTLIAWRHLGGHIWRYRLEPTEGGTTVTEEFDWRTARSPLALRLMRAPTRNRTSIEATLDRLAAHFSSTP